MARRRDPEAEARAEGRGERQERVGRTAGEERAGADIAEGEARKHPRREQRHRAETRSRERMARELDDGAGHHALQASPVACDPADNTAPGLPVAAEAPRRLLDGALEHDRGAIVEGVRERGGWMDPLEPVLAEWQLAEERRRRGERAESGRAHV